MKTITMLGLGAAALFVGVQMAIPLCAMLLWNSLVAPMGPPEMGICEAYCFSVLGQILIGRLGIWGLGR